MTDTSPYSVRSMGRPLLLWLAAFAVSPVAADTLVSWDLSGLGGNQTSTPVTGTATGITGLAITRGTGLGTSTCSDCMSSNGWEGTATGADALEYYSFGFSVGAGQSVTLTELAIGTRASGTGPGTLGLYTSLDGFTTALTTLTQNNTNTLYTLAHLSGLAGLTGTIEFRLIEIGNTQADGSGNTAAGGTLRLVADSTTGDIRLTGTIGTAGPDLEAPVLTAGDPASGAVGVDPVLGTLTLTYSEAIRAGDLTGLTLECPAAEYQPVTPRVEGSRLLIDIGDLPTATGCSLSVPAGAVTDLAGNPAASAALSFTTAEALAGCGGTYTPIPAIQGSGSAAAITGAVTTEGVVVGDYEGPSPALRGFYLQDPAGDGDETTADAIFVFHGDTDSVSLGQRVRVVGSAGEYQGQTQLSGVTEVLDCGAGATVTPVEVVLPVPAAVGGVDYLERYEGMLVRFPQTLTVTNHFQLGRFGTLELSANGRLMQGTEAALPGAAAQAFEAANLLHLIWLDDLSQAQNADPVVFPDPGLSVANPIRGGDTTTGLTGVLTYTWGGNSASPNAWRVRPLSIATVDLPVFVSNPRPDAAPAVGGTLRVAGLNVENYFVTIDDGVNDICGATANMECRGADALVDIDGLTEQERQRTKKLAALTRLDADILALVELENTPGVEPLADLVNGLNELTGAPTYAYVETGVYGGDAIRNGFIYRPARVTLVGDFAILDDGVDPRAIDTRNRPALAQSFAQVADGARLTVVVNHFKSKGSDCNTATGGTHEIVDPDTGDGQGNCNLTRTSMANALVDWLATDPTGAGDADYLILGDLNSYLQEDPLRTLESGGYANLVAGDPSAYSYTFNGRWGHLDHALASASLVEQVTGAAEYHINADEPVVFDYNLEFKTTNQHSTYFASDEFRIADHDPVLVGLLLDPPAPRPGDLDGNRAVDQDDLDTLKLSFNQDVTAANATGDLDGDGRITVLDLRRLVLLCDRPKCAR